MPKFRNQRSLISVWNGYSKLYSFILFFFNYHPRGVECDARTDGWMIRQTDLTYHIYLLWWVTYVSDEHGCLDRRRITYTYW